MKLPVFNYLSEIESNHPLQYQSIKKNGFKRALLEAIENENLAGNVLENFSEEQLERFALSRFPTVLRLGIPDKRYNSWSELPENPWMGITEAPSLSIKSESLVMPSLQKTQNFTCDPCHMNFSSKESFDKHMENHIFCHFPGCGFTCRRDKDWRMSLHIQMLHKCPNAPNLEDVEGYLTERKSRFPTEEAIQKRTEELLYKSSRGIYLSREQHRWLKRHRVEFPLDSRKSRKNHGEMNYTDDYNNKVVSPPAISESAKENSKGISSHLKRSQRIQKLREEFNSFSVVPRFYICHRCGAKGDHWMNNCPIPGVPGTESDKRYSNKEDVIYSSEKSKNDEIKTDSERPREFPAREENSYVKSSHSLPVSNTIISDKLQTKPQAPSLKRNQRTERRKNCSKSLYERLVEDQRLDEQGILLQAIKFFISENFLRDE